MRRLLESAAIQDDSVSIIADMSAEFSVPKRSVNLSIPRTMFKGTLDNTLRRAEESESNIRGEKSYRIQDIESAIVDSIFQIVRSTGMEPEYSEGMSRHVSLIIDNYFGAAFNCQTG